MSEAEAVEDTGILADLENPEKKSTDNGLDIERRVAVSLAVGRYLRASDRFNQASREFTGSCKDLRRQLGARQKFIVQVDFSHYLVTSDEDSNFNVEFIEKI